MGEPGHLRLIRRFGSAVLSRARNAPRKRPSWLEFWPLSRTEPSVQIVMAVSALDEETMVVVRISWNGRSGVSLDNEMVGEEVVSRIERWALAVAGGVLLA